MEETINIIMNSVNNNIITYSELTKQEIIAADKLHINNNDRLNSGELLLIYICYLIDNVFNINDSMLNQNNEFDEHPFGPLDIAIINNLYVKIASIGFDYEDKHKWLNEVITNIITLYNSFADMNDEDINKFFTENYSILDNLLYDYFVKQTSANDENKQRWEYLYEYNKILITSHFFKYINVYLETIDKLYGNEEEDKYDDNNNIVASNSITT